MADFIKNIIGGQKPVPAPASGDDDFADYAGAPSPEPASLSSFTTSSPIPAVPTSSVQGPYTAWYRVWERTTINDFKLEMYVLPFIIVVVAVHLWGTGKNRRKAHNWMRTHAPILQQEYAQIGFKRPQASADDVTSIGLLQASEKALQDAEKPENMIREKKADEYQSYATGRQNAAFTDFKLTLLKRYNPLMRLGESVIGLFFESMPATEERMEATTYAFDGKESKVVPNFDGKVPNSTFDGFVWAIVHKDIMKRMREDRYDISLTASKDHSKLPVWLTAMSESAEVTDTLLTPELIKALHEAGDNFEALIVSDQPMDQPKKLDDTIPRKRISLSLKLPSNYDSTTPIFSYFLRMPDILVSQARFRPEALRRIKQTREEQISKIKKLDDDEKAEERKLMGDKAKKDKRDQMLSRMSADEQRKYLEKEREREAKKRQKRSTVKA